MPAKITAAEFDTEVLGASVPVLADFYSDSCIPCKRMSPILSQLESEYSGRLKIVKINTNFETALTERYSVLAAPTLIFFKDGKEVSRIRGAVKKDELTALTETLI